MFEERPLDPAIHNRRAFDCGVRELNEYLWMLAEQHRRKGISVTYVLTEANQPRVILGYYTLSAAEIDSAELSEPHRKKLPRYPIPCFRLGRLACSAHCRGKGFGKLLLGSAVERCLKAREQVASFALIVDAKDNNAQQFYRHFGFISCSHTPKLLYLPLGRS